MRLLNQLRSKIEAALRYHWVAASSPEPTPQLQGAALEAMVKNVFTVMMTRQYRTGPLPDAYVTCEIHDRLRLCIAQGKPIAITLGFAPLKNQNAVSYSRADWAEFFALGHLAAWHNKVQKIYPPGLRIQIVFDDATLSMANKTRHSIMQAYMNSVKSLIRAMGYDSIMPRPFAHSSFAWLFHFGIYQWAAMRVRRWDQRPENREQLEKMNQAAGRNLSLKPGLSSFEQARLIHQASHRYRVYWESLQLVGFTRSRKRLIAMYLDGSQHHIKQQVALHLTTLDKGQVTQPWQGEGILLENGHGKWEPAVLTSHRKKLVKTLTLRGIQLLKMEGFNTITLAEPLVQANPAPVQLAERSLEVAIHR